jgi:catechol 2,3-dioxygenase-like lactoylglutathione lyase family enzyme
MPNQLHHVVMLSHSADRFIGFLTDVVGMDVQHSFRVPGEILETTLGWPPSDGADVTILGSGVAGLVEVLDVPEQLRTAAPEGLAALSFLADDYRTTLDRARQFGSDTTAACRWSSWAVTKLKPWRPKSPMNDAAALNSI